MKLILTAALLATTATAAFAAGHETVVRMGTEGAYPPFNYLDDNGEVAGFERELGDELCARAELTCEWVTNEWDSIIPNLVSGNYDTIIAGMSITDEREEVIDFSTPYSPPATASYVGTSADADIEGGVVAAQTGTIQASHVAETGAALLEFASPEETIAAVRSGEADAVLADTSFLTPFVEASGGELMFVGEPVSLDKGMGIGFRESDGELRAKFDAAITSMIEDGTLNEMIVKWFGDAVPTF